MQLTAAILSSVAALAGTAAAQAQAPHAAVDLRFPVPTAPPRPLAVRGSRTHTPPASISECYKSLEDVYLTMPTPGPALVQWAGDNLFKATDGGLCSATMPESLSADYKSYVPRIASWYAGASSTAEAVMAQCTELAERMSAEGGAGGMPVVSCTANPTIFWVNEQGKTRAEEQTVPPELRGGKVPAATAGQTLASSAAGSASAAATGSSSGAAPAKASDTSPAAASGTSPVVASGGSALRSVGLGMFAGAVAFAAVLI
ncbi:hypothetical protein RB597_005277 [Gaeumannomyces tritici]